MVFKILGIERTWKHHRQDFSRALARPRQIFITQSKVLATKVEEYYLKLSQSLAAEQRTSQESTRISFNKEQTDLIDEDEEDLYHSQLPDRFSALEDKHFPLFLTYDQVSATV